MFEISLILGIIVGFIRGGSFDRLSKIPFKFPLLIFIALLIQISLNIADNFIFVSRFYAHLIMMFSYLILLSALFFNRKEFYLQIITAGVILNFLVIAINGGMPVSMKSAKLIGLNEKEFNRTIRKDFKRIAISEKTDLNFLGDIVPIPPPIPFSGLFSLGDIFISIGIFLFIQSHLAYKAKRLKESGRQPLLN